MSNKKLCDYERQIRLAARNNSLNDELKKHLENCADCRETQKIVTFFQATAAKDRIFAKLPTAGFIWWKSQLQKKRDAAERAGKPIFFVEIAAVVIFCLISFWLINFVFDASFVRLLASLEQLILPIIGAVIVFAIIIVSTTLLFRRYLS